MRSQVWRGWIWIAVAGLAAFSVLAGYIALVHRVSPFALDAAVNSWIASSRTTAMISASNFMARIGAGILGDLIIPGVIAVAFLLARRWRDAAILVVATAVSGGTVQLLKILIDRARPPHALSYEASWSFPSGHSAHAATLVVALMLLLRWRWLIVVGAVYAVAMAASRVYLGVHWATDVVAGLVVGASVAILVVAGLDRALRRRVPIAPEDAGL